MKSQDNNIAVVRLTPDKIPEVGRLEKLCFSDPWSENAFFDACGNEMYDYFVAVDVSNSTVCGYGGIMTVLDAADITNIAVLPQYRRRGIGKMLLDTLVRAAEKRCASSLRLEVRESNVPAISLYEKFGFVRDGIRKNYYRHPTENAVLMTKTLEKEA